MDNSSRDDGTVSQRAYERYESRGREDGHDQEDWFAAEQDLRGRAEGERHEGTRAESDRGGPEGDSMSGGDERRERGGDY
jgi:hypothetical protein